MTGEYRNTVDEKGRLMIPPKFREQMGSLSELHLTKSINGSLWLYTKEGFDALCACLNSNPLAALNPDVQRISLLVINPARDIELDKAGRVSIPQCLREFAGIEPKSECVLLGAGDKVEIFNAAKYDAYVAENIGALGQSGEAISRMGQQ